MNFPTTAAEVHDLQARASIPAMSGNAVQAVLMVDVQRAFFTGAGAVPASAQLLEALSELLERSRRGGALVVHLQNDGPAGAVDEPGRPGWELYLPVGESLREVVIRKSRDDAFDGTGLGDLLKQRRVDRLCVVGVMSEMCVLATARAALDRGFGVVVPHDGHATYDIPPAPGASEGVPAAMASRVAEWALGDGVEVVAHTTDVSFNPLT
jgi:nicotinamidase-related amidase